MTFKSLLANLSILWEIVFNYVYLNCWANQLIRFSFLMCYFFDFAFLVVVDSHKDK